MDTESLSSHAKMIRFADQSLTLVAQIILRGVHDDDLRVIDTTCSKLLSTQGNKEDFLPSNHTLLVKTLKQFDNTLVIVYSTEDDLYYLFEELI